MLWNEDLLHFIWKFGLFEILQLKTTDHQDLKIFKVGQHNANAGPDFLFAKILIGSTEWIGHVELHINAQDWYAHKHDQDEAYNNVILHVIWEGDIDCRRQDHTVIPTLVLKNYVKEDVLLQYNHLIKSKKTIPCAEQMPLVNDLVKINWLQRMSVERLLNKYNLFFDNQSNLDWERIAFKLLCRSFGMKVNKEPFTKLAELIDINLLQKYRDDVEKINAIIFGQAGFLEDDYEEEYYQKVKSIYIYLKSIHHFPQMAAHEWKFLRMRPYNFPTYRLAQMARLYTFYPSLFSKIVEVEKLEEFNILLNNVKLDGFWESHFSFAKTTTPHSTNWGQSFVNHIVINCFALVLFGYGQYISRADYTEKALNWISSMKAEKNNIIIQFEQIGLKALNASDSQAMIHLYQAYCEKKKCLSCAIGTSVLKRSN